MKCTNGVQCSVTSDSGNHNHVVVNLHGKLNEVVVVDM